MITIIASLFLLHRVFGLTQDGQTVSVDASNVPSVPQVTVDSSQHSVTVGGPGQPVNVAVDTGAKPDKLIPCGKQLVHAGQYTCFENRIACPAPKTQLCGADACFNPMEYHCINGQLMQGPGKEDGLSGSSKSGHSNGLSDGATQHDSGSSSYPVAEPSPQAYERHLQDLSEQGISLTTIEKIKHELNMRGINLTTGQVAVILSHPGGPAAGLLAFEDKLQGRDKTHFAAALPNIHAILTAETKVTKTSSAPRPVPAGNVVQNNETTDGQAANGNGNGSGSDGSSGGTDSGTSGNGGTSSTPKSSLAVTVTCSLAMMVSAGFGVCLVLLY